MGDMNGSLRCEYIQTELAQRMQNASQRAAQMKEARYLSFQDQAERTRNKHDLASARRDERARREAEMRENLKVSIDCKVQRTQRLEAEYETMKNEMHLYRNRRRQTL